MREIMLSKLDLLTPARVAGINCNSSDGRRFLDLGIINGATVRPLFRSPLGDPTAYEICKSIIALREEDAERIIVTEI